MKRLFLPVLAAIACAGLWGCSDDELGKVPLPDMSDGSATLRVVRAIDPRLPRLSPKQFQTLLSKAGKIVKWHFGVHLRFETAAQVSVAELFGKLPSHVIEAAAGDIYDFKTENGNRPQLIEHMENQLRENNSTLDEMVVFARPHMKSAPEITTYRSFAEALVDTLLGRLEVWKRLDAADGTPIIDARPHNEWIYWDNLGYGDLPFDLIITNQLVASAEYTQQTIHTAIRGGLTVGTTTYNRDGRYKSVSWLSTFPFLSNEENVAGLREGEVYGPDEASRLAGAYLGHEIGHMLFHFGHPYGNSACVMDPVRLLQFRNWLTGLDPAKCPIGGSAAMSPGAVDITYDKGL